LIRIAAAHLLFLPPWNPDLIPIEINRASFDSNAVQHARRSHASWSRITVAA
jgi:transposase